jgi:hypothetical protein
MVFRNLIIFSALILTLLGSNSFSKEVSVESLLPKSIGEGWTLASGPETYTKKTLFRHINGQAELFFKYGFQRSAFAIYQDKKNDKNQIEVDVYHMGSVLQAFGVFSRFRNEDRPAGIGLDSYFDDRSLIFYKGQYFVMLYATESDSSILKEWAMMVSSRISDPSPPPKEIGLFPKNGLIPGSIQYFSEGLLGYQFLKRGFQGTYGEKGKDKDKVKDEVKAEDKDKTTADGKEIHLFLAIFNNSQDAAYALKTYSDSLSKKGKVHSGIPTPFEPNALRGEDPYRGKVILVPKGFYLAGIIGFENLKSAEKLLEEFVKNIR